MKKYYPAGSMIFFSLFLSLAILPAKGQTYLYFQDSPTPDYYDYSWMELTPPSELERKVEPDLRKFPVESAVTAQQGINSLRLKWRSVSGGNWVAIAAGSNWTARDLTDTDTLVCWLQSLEGITSVNLPYIFMEDLSNRKSIFIALSGWSGDLSAGNWTRITVPMDLFLNAGDGVDYSVIKTIGFAQQAADGEQHTLLVDNMRVNKGDGSFPSVEAPAGVKVTPYEYHFEVQWEKNPDPQVTGYQVERSVDGGNTYAVVKLVDASQSACVDWVKLLGSAVEATYRVKALNGAGEPSAPSGTATGITHALTDEELLDMVQSCTFRYFWDFAHEASGMSRERNTSGNTVTSGGSGFGLMAIPVGIERGYITREEGVTRTLKILGFLQNADRFHGAWSHWINGNTGEVIPFSTYDNGGDIVETSYVAQGLLTIRQYFSGTDPDERQIVQLATALWEGIEWDWYRKDGSPAIYWHWSPNYGWQMNMKVAGWNEAAIVYLLAIASPTHGVPASLWHTGWAGNSNYVNGKSFYGHTLYVGSDWGGPLFFAHYSFLGFDPRNKSDGYANYFDQNRNHSLIQQTYCENNPNGYTGYSSECWGLTASDDPDGYLAHEPYNRDNGTITPTAALSSFPYTPEESMLALKYFYRQLGARTWDRMGFLDAFNLKRDWYATSYLAIDQGPILLMIENYRSQLLWNLFMSNPEIQPMMDAIGFYESPNAVKAFREEQSVTLYPNPSSGDFRLNLSLDQPSSVRLELYEGTGEKVGNLLYNQHMEAGSHSLEIHGPSLGPGIYLIRLLLNETESRMIKWIKL
jgi:hypothetical protein